MYYIIYTKFFSNYPNNALIFPSRTQLRITHFFCCRISFVFFNVQVSLPVFLSQKMPFCRIQLICSLSLFFPLTYVFSLSVFPLGHCFLLIYIFYIFQVQFLCDYTYFKVYSGFRLGFFSGFMYVCTFQYSEFILMQPSSMHLV